MEILEKILKFLSGKKAIIASIIGLVTSYLATKGILGEPEVILINGLTMAIFGTASVMTGKMYKKLEIEKTK